MTTRTVVSRTLAVLWLALVWVVLFESYDASAVLGGLVVGTSLVAAFPAERRRGLDAFRPWYALRFLGYFAWQVVKANAVVAWEVITPGDQVNEGIVEIPVTGASDAVAATLANVISLTPGTLILEVVREPRMTLYVHVLHLRDIDVVRLDIFELERQLVRAIGSEACLRDVEERIAALRRTHPELDRRSGLATGPDTDDEVDGGRHLDRDRPTGGDRP